VTARRNFKRQVRARVAKTGESYTAALRHFLPTPGGEPVEDRRPFRLAVGQLALHGDPADTGALRRSGNQVRDLMRDAARAGARLLLLPEGATCSPDKRVVSASRPGPVGADQEVGPARWERVAWDVLREELELVAALAGRLRLWTVLGSTHRLGAPHRPHNCLYVLSADGAVHTRYDERYLSRTKSTLMYSPGAGPVAFEVDGWRFGCALGMESTYPEVFAAYEQQDVDCVLLASSGDPDGDAAAFARESRAHAAVNAFWVGFSVPPQADPEATSGVVAPDGRWPARCAVTGAPALVTADLDDGSSDAVRDAVSLARPWRRRAREEVRRATALTDARSTARGSF